MGVRDRGDVDDDKSGEEVWLGQGQGHGDLAAHGMADQGDGCKVKCGDHVGDIEGHFRIGHAFPPRGGTVVTQIEAIHEAIETESFSDEVPIASGSQESMKYQQRSQVRGLERGKFGIGQHRIALSEVLG